MHEPFLSEMIACCPLPFSLLTAFMRILVAMQ